MKIPVASVEVARAVAEPRLRAWEIDAGVSYKSPIEFRLRYVGADIVDDGRSNVLHVEDRVHLGDAAVPFTSRMRYPVPPNIEAVPLEAEAIWARVGRYLTGEETLLSAAYFCFTVLKRDGEPKTQAAARLGIPTQVLDALSRLSSTRGDAMSARKMSDQLQPLTAQEEQWLRHALLEITRHLLHRRPGGRTSLDLQPPPMDDPAAS
jgi:hypothetical protein